MKPLLALCALPLLVPATAGAVGGGTTLPIAQAPYVAWIDARCTGTLITPTRILTAGHCLMGHSATGEEVVVGVDGNTATSAQRKAAAVQVAGYSVDPMFKESFPFAHTSPQNAIATDDVGLIVLKQPVTGVAPVRLGAVQDGAPVSLIGYGMAGENLRPPLQVGALSVLDAATCAKSYPHALQPSMFCSLDTAHTTPPFAMACPGDSGGPVIAGGVQIGVTSWGAEVKNGACAMSHLPDVSMRVSSFGAFIDQPHPPIEPYTLSPGGPFGVAAHLRGRARVGRTITCSSPRLGGANIRLRYDWQVESGVRARAIAGRHKAKLTVTRAMYDRADQAKRILCVVTASNRGGALVMNSGSLHMSLG